VYIEILYLYTLTYSCIHRFPLPSLRMRGWNLYQRNQKFTRFRQISFRLRHEDDNEIPNNNVCYYTHNIMPLVYLMVHPRSRRCQRATHPSVYDHGVHMQYIEHIRYNKRDVSSQRSMMLQFKRISNNVFWWNFVFAGTGNGLTAHIQEFIIGIRYLYIIISKIMYI